MEIIDFHAHIYPKKISHKAVDSVGKFYGLHMECDGTAENLLELGSKCGITGYVVQSVAIDAGHVRTINDYIASECRLHPEFYGFGTMHAAFPDKIEELERIRSLGLLGVKIHPDTQQYNMDDCRMDEVYDYLSQNDMPVLIHCGDYRYGFSHPKRLAAVLNRFPSLTVIGAHFGGWSLWDLALEYLRDKSCFFDTSSSFEMLGLERSRELIKIYGADRILFGTDFPMWRPAPELDCIYRMGLTDAETEKILSGNAKRILKKF